MADIKMPLSAHLEELRWRLIKSLAAVGVAFLICYNFADVLVRFLTIPLIEQYAEPATLIGTGVAEAFFTKLKVSAIAAVFLAFPFILYHAWQFVAPGLLDQEKQYARPFVVFGTIFFLVGAAFCYEVVFPIGFAFFLAEYQTIGVDPSIRISEYLSFTSMMMLAFGVVFELPLVVFFLARMGLVTHRTMIRQGRYALLVIIIVAAILTPPDVASQMLMAVPLALLYVISIGVAYLVARPRAGTDDTRE